MWQNNLCKSTSISYSARIRDTSFKAYFLLFPKQAICWQECSLEPFTSQGSSIHCSMTEESNRHETHEQKQTMKTMTSWTIQKRYGTWYPRCLINHKILVFNHDGCGSRRARSVAGGDLLQGLAHFLWRGSVPLVPVPQAPASFRTPERREKLEKAGEKCPIWIQKPYGICPCFPYLELFALADQAEPAATPQAEGSLWLLEELGPRGGMRAFTGTAPVALIEVTGGATLVTLQRPIAQLPSSLDAHWAQEFVRHFGISHALRLAG